MLCGICNKAHELQLLTDTVADRRLEDAFISSGMNNWKHALDKFRSHEKTHCHSFAAAQLEHYSNSAAISAQLSQQISDDQAIAQKALRVIITSVLYLARQGLPLRGHDNSEGNFSQLLLLRCSDDPALKRWFEGRYKQFTSWAVQNELLELSAHRILRELCATIRRAKQYSIIVDGTTDMSCTEQESIVVRYSDDNLSPHEVFLGFYTMSSGTDGKTIAKMICDVLLRLNLPIAMLRAQTYDGAANMSGKFNGAQALVAKEQPLALYVHCLMHCGNLAAQSALESTACIRNSTALANDLAVFSRQSTKLSNILKSVQVQHDQAASLLRPLCPTRVLCRGPALKCLLKTLSTILIALEQFADECQTTDVAAKARGFAISIGDGDFVLGVKMAILVLDLFENLNRAAQSSRSSVSAIITAMQTTADALAELRTDDAFKEVFADVVSTCQDLDIPLPKLPRVRRPPKRFTGQAAAHNWQSAEEYFRCQFFHFIDNSVNQLQQRYEQPGLRQYVKLEQILLTQHDTKDVEAVVANYPELDADRLNVQLSMLRQQNYVMTNVADIVDKIVLMPSVVRSMFDQVEQLVRLLLTIPASSAEAERSFSSLRRLKSYLRTTMKQERLNHCTVLHVHQAEVDNLDVIEIAQDFIDKCETRRATFGRLIKH